MSNAVSALGGVSDVDGIVDISEVGPQGMITLRGDLASAEIAAAFAGIGCVVPEQRRIVHAGDLSAAWMSPDEVLILCPYAEVAARVASLSEAVAGTHALVANVSDARAMFRVSGPVMRDVVAKLAPVDMSQASFAPGEMRRTRLAQVAAAFHLRDEATCEIVCFRSVAQYVYDLLKAVSRPGSEVGFHEA